MKIFLALAVSVFLAASAQAQKKSEPAANTPAQSNDSFFSSDSNLVLIDSIVTDRKGGYIGDLTQKDFKVREDGKEQAITVFSHLAEGAPDDQKHYLVLLFDNSTVPQVDLHYAQDAAMKFIGLNAGPNRLTAVVELGQTLRVTQNLTDDAARLKGAVNAVQLSSASANPMRQGMGRPMMRFGSDPAKALPAALENLAKGMAKVPGRKTIVFFSEGLSVSPDVMKGAIEECNRVNAAVYPVDIGALGGRSATLGGADSGRGMAAIPVPGRNTGPFGTQGAGDLSASAAPADILYTLARGTGGFVISGAGSLADDLNRIGKEQSQYYVLGYLPAKEPVPGTCHTIKVDVARGGSNVRARTAYCDEKTPEVVTGTVPERDLEARLNANAAPTVQATMQTPFFYVAPNTARVDLALDIPGAGVKFTKDKGKFTAKVNVIGIAYLPDNGVAARFNETAKVALDDQQQVDEFASRPFHFEKQFEMAAGQFSLKVAFSSGAGSFGRIETPLTIEPWEPSKFQMSALALSETTRPASPAGLGDVDLFGDQVPLVASGVQYLPAGTNRLRASEKVYVYGEIYGPAPGMDAQLSVLNTKTGEVVKKSDFMGLNPETVPGTSAVPFSMIWPTDGLAPGSYAVQIAAQDAAGNHAVRRIDFEIER